MKITIIAGFLLPVPAARGGAMEKTWGRLAENFAAAGHEVIFISRRWPGWPDREIIAGVRHLRLRGADHTRNLAINLLLDFIWGLRVTLALPRADVVITNTVALPVWLRRIKPSAGRVVAVIARMPKGQVRLYSGVDLLLSLSRAVTSRIVSENPRLAARVAPFPLPIDWQLHANSAARGEPLTIGYIGRLNPEKGIDLLLAATALLSSRSDLPPWRLLLLGPVSVPSGGGGELWLESLLSRYASALGARLNILPPEYDPAKLARHYGSLDIFCYPSLAEQGETFGVAVAEAMAAGCAPVVSGLACFNDLVRDGDTGLVFDHQAPDAAPKLATSLSLLLKNADLRRQISHRAQNHSRQFDYSAVASSVLSTLDHLITPSRASPPES